MNFYAWNRGAKREYADNNLFFYFLFRGVFALAQYSEVGIGRTNAWNRLYRHKPLRLRYNLLYPLLGSNDVIVADSCDFVRALPGSGVSAEGEPDFNFEKSQLRHHLHFRCLRVRIAVSVLDTDYPERRQRRSGVVWLQAPKTIWSLQLGFYSSNFSTFTKFHDFSPHSSHLI